VMLSDSERIDANALASFISPLQASGQGVKAMPFASVSQAAQVASHASVAQPETVQPSWAEAMAGFEKRFLSEALRANGGRVVDAAAQIGMGRATLYKKIAAYGIEV
jgi:DNA-binding NtrC family response regulator